MREEFAGIEKRQNRLATAPGPGSKSAGTAPELVTSHQPKRMTAGSSTGRKRLKPDRRSAPGGADRSF